MLLTQWSLTDMLSLYGFSLTARKVILLFLSNRGESRESNQRVVTQGPGFEPRSGLLKIIYSLVIHEI